MKEFHSSHRTALFTQELLGRGRGPNHCDIIGPGAARRAQKGQVLLSDPHVHSPSTCLKTPSRKQREPLDSGKGGEGIEESLRSHAGCGFEGSRQTPRREKFRQTGHDFSRNSAGTAPSGAVSGSPSQSEPQRLRAPRRESCALGPVCPTIPAALPLLHLWSQEPGPRYDWTVSAV
ncbi:hypothetical protein SKAU_G00393550 [Synaphobranchus kaupii]|uniref:Uncharacterized protein n=1 Tax=Synaphobranchus kaupii TaxID=118154 RepID=A0A9Q1EC11_SYNKA|nr:hypothetical protein SKAU_G00393550 [Synaphobranchus kaupii]